VLLPSPTVGEPLGIKPGPSTGGVGVGGGVAATAVTTLLDIADSRIEATTRPFDRSPAKVE
jgi:hypothetical protein